MPTYDYECDSCSHSFEAFQSMSDDALSTCPACGTDSLRRLVGGGLGVIFRGSGFYVNDSKKSSAGAKSSSSAESGSGDSGTSKSDGSGSASHTDSSSSKSESSSGGSSATATAEK